MNMKTDLSKNPFLAPVEVSIPKVGSRLENVIDRVLRGGNDKPFRVVLFEDLMFGNNVLTEQRLLFLMQPPATGWDKASVFHALAVFRSGNTELKTTDRLQMFIGARQLNGECAASVLA